MLVFFDAIKFDGKLFYRNETINGLTNESSLYQDSDLFLKGISTESHYLIGELFPQSTYFVLDEKTRVLIKKELEKYNHDSSSRINAILKNGVFRYLVFDQGYYLGHDLVRIFSRKDFNF